jgi:hypothetical protein
MRETPEQEHEVDSLLACSFAKFGWCIVKRTHWTMIIVVNMTPQAIYRPCINTIGLYTFQLPLICASVSELLTWLRYEEKVTTYLIMYRQRTDRPPGAREADPRTPMDGRAPPSCCEEPLKNNIGRSSQYGNSVWSFGSCFSSSELSILSSKCIRSPQASS